MTIEELLDRIEEIKSSLENADDPHGIEGAVDELFILKDDIEIQGIERYDSGEQILQKTITRNYEKEQRTL